MRIFSFVQSQSQRLRLKLGLMKLKLRPCQTAQQSKTTTTRPQKKKVCPGKSLLLKTVWSLCREKMTILLRMKIPVPRKLKLKLKLKLKKKTRWYPQGQQQKRKNTIFRRQTFLLPSRCWILMIRTRILHQRSTRRRRRGSTLGYHSLLYLAN